MPKTRSLMTLRAISVVPPPICAAWRDKNPMPSRPTSVSSGSHAIARLPGELEGDRDLARRVHTVEQPRQSCALVGQIAGPHRLSDPIPREASDDRVSPQFADPITCDRIVETTALTRQLDERGLGAPEPTTPSPGC